MATEGGWKARDDFLIRDDIVFLNHGSFGACPKPVFAAYQRWQLELERQPIDFLIRRRESLLAEARARLGDYVNAPADDLVFVSNATTGLSIALRSLDFAPGDEILTTNQEYGAVNRLLDFVAAKSGATIRRQPVPLPWIDDGAFVDGFFDAASPATKAIVISHITSPTALILPVAEICRRARRLGILTIIDGAHAPGQVNVDLNEIGADMYAGNCHKWLCAPKGSAFLHTRGEHQALIEPLVISHGARPGASYVERLEWSGTRDIAGWLSVPAAIDFQREHNWNQVRSDCHDLARWTQAQLNAHFDTPPLSRNQFAQMVTILLPACDAATIQKRLLDEYRIEVPLGEMAGVCGVRVSFQAYNTGADAKALVDALKSLLD